MAAVELEASGRPGAGASAVAGVPLHRDAELPEGFWYGVKRRVLGPPLVTEQLQ